MRLFLIRYSKIAFSSLRLHKVFGFLSRPLSNLVYMTRLSAFISKNKGVLNDFPCKWNYNKRYDFYNSVLLHEGVQNIPIQYLEFGVAQGTSMRWMIKQNKHPDSRFHGFDTFTGLPEDFGSLKKGTFNNNEAFPQVDDQRVSFYKGLFQETLPAFNAGFTNHQRNVLMMDADLYSATFYVLSSFAQFLKKGDIIFFDQFAVPTHEFRAFSEFVESYYVNLELIGAANNYYFVAFRVA
jgi:O-methyltransferase